MNVNESSNEHYASLWVDVRWDTLDALLPFIQAAAQQTTDEAHAEITNLMNHMRSTLQRRPVDLMDGLL